MLTQQALTQQALTQQALTQQALTQQAPSQPAPSQQTPAGQPPAQTLAMQSLAPQPVAQQRPTMQATTMHPPVPQNTAPQTPAPQTPAPQTPAQQARSQQALAQQARSQQALAQATPAGQPPAQTFAVQPLAPQPVAQHRPTMQATTMQAPAPLTTSLQTSFPQTTAPQTSVMQAAAPQRAPVQPAAPQVTAIQLATPQIAAPQTAAPPPPAVPPPAVPPPAVPPPAVPPPAVQPPGAELSALERALQASALAAAAPADSTLELVARQTAALEAAVLHTLATAATPAAAATPATTARLVQSVLSARAAASLATADHDALVSAPDSTLLRQRRRDELLDHFTGSPPEQEEMIMAAAAGQSAEFGEWAEATNVGPIALEQFEHDIRSIARTYLSSPPLPVVLTTLRVRNRAFALLEGRQYPNQARQLYLIAGRVCGLLAWMSSDLGRHMEAETQARTGWLCAELAEHDGLRAWIRATQSKLAYWDGRIKESAQLAEHGLQYACPDTAPVLLASLAARAWARLGRADDAHSALANAAEKREHAGPDEVGGLYGFSAAQQCYLAGTTHLYLQEPDDALREAEQAVALYEAGEPSERFYGAETLALIDAATAHLQGGELAGTAEKLGPVLALPSQQRLATFTQRLSDMRDALRRSRHADATESIQLQRQIEDFQGEALGQLVGARP
jgi:hypothetical protein